VEDTSKDLKARKKGKGYTIQRKEYVTYLGNVEAFKGRLFEAAVRLGCFEYEQIVVVSDGAVWIRNLAEELFPDCVQILDFSHVAENRFSFGKYLYPGEGKEARRWAEPLVDLLREGKAAEVLERPGEYEGKRYGEGVVNPHTHLKNNIEGMDYKRYREKGYYIGSGPVESVNKTVVQKRPRQLGCRSRPV
jgi:hypothetical protein